MLPFFVSIALSGLVSKDLSLLTLLLTNSLGSFSNHDGDGNEDVKKAMGSLRKTTTLHVNHPFCTSLYRPCTIKTWKCLIASFMEDVNKRRRISFSLSKLGCGPKEINSREICLHLPFSANWNKRRLPLPSSMLKLPINFNWKPRENGEMYTLFRMGSCATLAVRKGLREFWDYIPSWFCLIVVNASDPNLSVRISFAAMKIGVPTWLVLSTI